MQLGRVLGTVTTTVKHPTFQGERLLVVQLRGRRRPGGRRAGAGLRPARRGSGRYGAGDERRADPPGTDRQEHARALERDGTSRPMTPSWPEVNAAVLAVLSEFGRSRRPAERPIHGHRDVFVERLFSLRHAEVDRATAMRSGSRRGRSSLRWPATSSSGEGSRSGSSRVARRLRPGTVRRASGASRSSRGPGRSRRSAGACSTTGSKSVPTPSRRRGGSSTAMAAGRSW